MDMEMLLISSEEPFVTVRSSAFPSKRGFVKRSALPFGRAKYISGINPPTTWLSAVAAAAPKSPSGKTATSSASSTMLVTPDATVTYRPACGRSAAMKKL